MSVRNTLLLILIFCLCLGKLHSQTILQRGDLAVVGVNSNIASSGTLSTKDEISFVCFKPITTGTEIQILDAGYQNCVANFWSCGQEGGAKFTRTGGTIPAGTVITFRNTSPYTFLSPDNGWSVTDLFVHASNTNYSVLAADFNINAGGDQVYFCQGGTWTEQSTLCTIGGNRTSPNAAFPGNNGRVLFGFSTSGGWQSFQQSSGESGLYPGLECFSMAPTNTPYSKYSGPVTAATQTQWISRIANQSNWTTYTQGNYASSGINFAAGYTLNISVGGGIPTATWTAPATALCSDGASINLDNLITGTTGGTWSGTGVTGNTFNPTGLNGSYNITYTVPYTQNAVSCPIAQTSTITVVQASAPTVASSTVNLCQNVGTTALTATGTGLLWYTSATGGTGSSTAPVPSTATVGTTNYYVSQTISGCESPKKAITVSVKASTSVNAVNNMTVCANSPTDPISFSGSSNTLFSWTNNNTSIGLAASGTGNISSFTALNSGTTTATANITVTPAPIVYAYVANYGIPLLNAGNVSVVNTLTNIVSSTITAGSNPFGVAISPNASRVYITNFGSNSVSVINTANNTVVATIAVGSQPMGIVVSPDGNKVYVVNQGSVFTPGTPGTLSVIDAATNTVSATVTLALQPQGICISPDGGKVYVANVNSNNVHVINTATNTQASVIGVGSQPITVAISPDGSRLYVPNYGTNNVSVINTATNAIVATVAVGTAPNGAAISPDGSKVYVTNQVSGNVSVINTSNNTVTTTVTVGTTPQGVSFTSDGTRAYIANFGSNNVSVINTSTNAVTSTFAVGTAPHSLGNFIMPSPCNGNPIDFTISVNPLPATPVASVTQQPTCSSPTGTITVSSPTGTGITYSTDGTSFQSSNVFSNLSAGSYTVTVKNADNCTRTSATITVNAPASAPAAPVTNVTQPTCTTSTGSITITSPTGTGLTYSVDGTNFQTGTTFSNLSPNTYTVTVRDASGCSNTSSATINNVSGPSTPVLTTTQPTCTTSTGSITVSSPTGTGFSYSIDGANFQNGTTFSNLAPNTYTVTVRNASNCTNSNTATLSNPNTVPAPTFTVTQPTCSVPTGSVNIISPIANTAEYSLDGTNFQSSGSFTGLTPNNYTMYVRIGGGCTNSAPFIINAVPSQPSPPIATTPISYCQNATATALTANGSNLLWYTTQTGGTGSSTAPVPSTASMGSTNYYVSQSVSGCESPRTLITVDIVSPLPTPTITANGPTSFCDGGNIVLTSSSSINNQWLRNGSIIAGATNTTYTATTNGNYTVSVSNSSGCSTSSIATAVTVNSNPVVFAGVDVFVNDGDSARLMASVTGGTTFTYLWSPSIYLNDATVLQPWVVKPLTDQLYTLTITNEHGCTNNDDVLVSVLREIIPPNAFSPNGDNVNDRWEIPNLSGYPFCTVEVFARSGQTVYSSIGYSKPFDGTRNGKPLPIGVYYYIINLKNGKPVKSGTVTLLR